MPPNLPNGHLVATGGNGAVAAIDGLSGQSLFVGDSDNARIVLTEQTAAPGGGTFQLRPTGDALYLVSPVTVIFRAAVRLEDFSTEFRFAITGTAGSRWRVLRLTTAFPDWLPLESVGLVELGDEELTLEIPVETAPFAFHQLEQEP